MLVDIADVEAVMELWDSIKDPFPKPSAREVICIAIEKNIIKKPGSRDEKKALIREVEWCISMS